MGCCLCPDDSPTKVDPKVPERPSVPEVPGAPDVPEVSGSDPMNPPNEDEIFVPTKKRSCTDIFASLIVAALVIGFGVVIASIAHKGDIKRITMGYDKCLNICGMNNSQKAEEFEKHCASGDMTNKTFALIEFGTGGVEPSECVEDCKETKDTIQVLHWCISKKIANAVPGSLKEKVEEFFKHGIDDITICRHNIFYLTLFALGMSLGVLIAFRYLVKWIVYIVLIGTTLACIGGTGYLWYTWNEEKKKSEAESRKSSFFIYAILMSIWTFIVLLIIMVMRKRIGLVTQLFKEAGRAIYSMPALLLQPIYTYAFGLAIVACAGFVAMWIESAGDIQKSGDHLEFKKDVLLHLLRWYNLFFVFFGLEFVFGCQHMVIATAVARWFFTRDKSKLSLPIVRGISCMMRFHLGTVCFGALVIAVIRLMRAILHFIQNRLKHYDNKLVKGILCCCQCCLWCFESVLKFLTTNAYIETAIYGCSFCAAGRKAFRALTNNIIRVAAINSVGDFVLFLGKIAVVAVTCALGVHLIHQEKGLTYPWVPVTVVGVIAYLMAHCFISVFEMIIDTIFICFCEDCEKHSDGGLHFMSRGLMQYVKNSEKALKKLDQYKKEQRQKVEPLK